MAKKIRVLFDANPLTRQKTGVGFYTDGLVRALAQIPDIELVGHYFEPRGVMASLPKAGNLRYTSNRWLVGQGIKALRKLGVRLPWEFLSRTKADVLWFPDFTMWPSLHRKSRIVTVHDLTFVDHPEYVTKPNLRYLKRYVKRDALKAAKILTVSEFSKSRMVKFFKLSPDKILVEPIPPPPAVKPKSSFKLPRNFLLFIGTIEPRKNVAGLVDAYCALPDEFRQTYSLVIAGGVGWHAEETIKQIMAAQDEGYKIITPGYVNEATRAALYSEAAAVIMPSFYEGFGMPLLEAMSYGAPVAASDISVFREVAGPAALYFDTKSRQFMREAIEKLLTDDKLRQRLTKQGLARVQKNSWRKVADEVYDEIKKLVN